VIPDPAVTRVEADLAAPAFRAGEMRGRWRVVSRAFPILFIEIAANQPDGSCVWYRFRVEVSGYPGQPPEVRIWDPVENVPLAPRRRPKGSRRVQDAFKEWGDDTVYRPWDRKAGVHNSFRELHPQLAWHAKRDLAFVLEDIHGLLNLNARTGPPRSAT